MSDTTGLVACPLCSEHKGYMLIDGSTFRWWSMCCNGCGTELAEVRADIKFDFPPERTVAADAAWNEAGAHAQSLRDRIAELEHGIDKALLSILRSTKTP
jgi:hypothetical protein